LEETVPEEEKLRRLHVLQDLQKQISLEKNKALEGKTLEVLVEGVSRDGGQWMGRTRTHRIVNFSGPEGLVGRLLPVTIEEGCQNSLRGRCFLTRDDTGG
jgi:tRNA-2-methylthio-N6-dimethylallyladenosine synthase